MDIAALEAGKWYPLDKGALFINLALPTSQSLVGRLIVCLRTKAKVSVEVFHSKSFEVKPGELKKVAMIKETDTTFDLDLVEGKQHTPLNLKRKTAEGPPSAKPPRIAPQEPLPSFRVPLPSGPPTIPAQPANPRPTLVPPPLSGDQPSVGGRVLMDRGTRSLPPTAD